MSSCLTVRMVAISSDDRKYLEDRRGILADLAMIQSERDDKIRALLEEHATVADLVRLTGLTRARIYQIRDRGR